MRRSSALPNPGRSPMVDGYNRIMQRRDARFRELWKLIAKTYVMAPHAFVKGCGQETMAYWVRTVTGVWVRPKELRRALDEAVDVLGLMHRTRGEGCTRYTMAPR